MRWYRVELPHYVAGFCVDDDMRIVAAAPIMASWIGVSVHLYADWARKKGGSFVRIDKAEYRSVNRSVAAHSEADSSGLERTKDSPDHQ